MHPNAAQRRLLANDEATDLILRAWQAASFWRVGRYVIMSDHIHLFCAPNTFPPRPLGKWIEFRRNQVTRAWPHRANSCNSCLLIKVAHASSLAVEITRKPEARATLREPL